MNTFNTPAGMDLNSLDPRGGVLVSTVYWRPQPKDPDPEQPGAKVSMVSYLPTKTNDPCPCGSGKRFGDCCQPLPYWEPVCPNSDLQGYSTMHPQEALFSNVPTDAIYDFLQNDERLYCVQDTPPYGFWTYWGDPAFETPPYGIVCFGDLELQEDGTFLVTALSDKRMQMLLDLLKPLNLDAPQIQRDPPRRVQKPMRKGADRKRGRQS